MPPDNTESDPSVPAGTEPLACVSCRARKLKCDRIKPACSRCTKVSNDCVYPESRRKPTFKRRNVKELEARLAQVEDYLKDVNKAAEGKVDDDSPDQPTQPDMDFGSQDGLPQTRQDPGGIPEARPQPFVITDFVPPNDTASSFFDDAQLMGLGMSEALPPLDVMEELNASFFADQHFFIPIVHPGRYLQAFYSSPLMKPPVCLQYAIWALAALGHAKYDKYHEVFYERARNYAEKDEMKDQGEHFITVAHAQTWGLIASYEAKRMIFTRSSISSAKTVRLCHMMSLDRIDGDLLGFPPSLGPPLSWAELEERRRVFWGAFCFDSHASISTGWPSLINTEDIATRLPAPEDAFIADRKVEAPFLHEVFQGATYSGFAGTVVVCQIFKSILRHVHYTKPTDDPGDVMHGTFWRQHRELDNSLSSLFMFLPEKLRLPQNLRDPTAIHTNLNFHASIICLHHAAIEKVEEFNLPDSLKQTSLVRLKAAADEIANIIKIASHAAAIFKSPLCALSLYCATTVYVYLAKQDPIAGLTAMDISHLEVIINAMEAISRTHTITRAFLQQARLDIERNGLDSCVRIPTLRKYRNAFGEVKSNIPMLARTSIAKHTSASPLVPGRTVPRNGYLAVLDAADVEDDIGNVIGRDCFHTVLGAVTRNVTAPQQLDVPTNKRKRMSPSPGRDQMSSLGRPPSVSAHTFKDAMAMPTRGGPRVGTAMFPLSAQMAQGNLHLPDRTSSSASSPANHGSSSRTTSGSSHTSPDMGLGNTAEDNRVDLRAFQDRIMTPIWPTADETFFAQINETMINILPADGGDAWGILDTQINWDATNTMAAMISYVVGLVAIFVVFSNPISQLLFPDQAGRRQHAASTSRPRLNESLLAIDGPNATIPECAPDAYTARILHREPLVVYLEGFVSDEERQHLLDISSPLFEPSTITNDGDSTHRNTLVRDSQVAVIPRSDTVRCIEQRARALQGWPSDLFVERLRTQKYEAGGHYGYHFDWTANVGGWGRVTSIMAWVDGSKDLQGGGTAFPLIRRPQGKEARREWCRFIECDDEEEVEHQSEEKQNKDQSKKQGVVFKVVPGNAVYWENFAPDGRGYEKTWHAGLPVDEGLKVGLNIWNFGRIQ
ncbi:hypothetical protein B0J13DRAFT_581109 [Dactylonectria estremocensis]|uniref:Zn(2)-C6 fungal-type domain-containing protein n=1 Tax=Dactylonectria estremocensis TaxID=1079267 RepID=A0A9P9FEI8_9HYPO|nr:hypothetical protein B0J13DRAFT_581109 [Dactylonectria estremocensis]